MSDHSHGASEEQWWLGKLGRHGNIDELIDGPHPDQDEANKAYYLHRRLGFVKTNVKYAVVRCELFEPVAEASQANEEALDALNSIGLRPEES